MEKILEGLWGQVDTVVRGILVKLVEHLTKKCFLVPLQTYIIAVMTQAEEESNHPYCSMHLKTILKVASEA